MTPFNRRPAQAITPLLTPFREGAVDFAALGASVDRQIVAGMDGIIVCDVIGEGHAVTPDERDAIMASCVERGRLHLSVIVAAGTNCTRTTIEQCCRAEDLGADALLVTVPYYSKPSLAGVVDHFRQVSAAISIPVIIDDDPARTGKDYGPELLERLSEFQIVVGICHGMDRVGHFAKLPGYLRDRFLHLTRDDRTLDTFLKMGGHGAISPIANVVPSPVQTLVSMASGSGATSTQLGLSISNLARVVECDDVAVLKEAASFIHQVSAEVRLPLISAEPEAVIRVRRAFAPYARVEHAHQAAA